MVLVNPELINMGTTGYGLAGRRIRDEIISAFSTSYYLRTLSWGAVTRFVHVLYCRRLIIGTLCVVVVPAVGIPQTANQRLKSATKLRGSFLRHIVVYASDYY